MQHVAVPLADTPYDILIAGGVLAAAGPHMRKAGMDAGLRVFIVADAAIVSTALPVLSASLENAGFDVASPYVVPSGEASKSFASYQAVMSHLLEQGLRRDSVVVALGGGVVGDLAGFAAATAMRGVRLVQAPTTLLSQVDSSVGGKTGINTPEGKNLVGSFHHPALVLIDPQTLKTLPRREMLAGYAEILKYALLGDATFFDWLEAQGEAVLAGDPAALSGAIATSCRAKAAIVAADPAERTGRRALLNLGHTFGHALEALGGYDGRLLHGEAVAIGMRWAFLYAAAEGLCAAEAGIRMEAHMRKTGLPFTPPFAVRAGDIAAAMTGDKKNAAGRGITLVLPRAIGAAFVSPGHAPATIEGFLKKILETEMTHAR